MHEPYSIAHNLRPDGTLAYDSSFDNEVILKDTFASSVASNAVLYRHCYSLVSDPPKTLMIFISRPFVTTRSAIWINGRRSRSFRTSEVEGMFGNGECRMSQCSQLVETHTYNDTHIDFLRSKHNLKPT